ncbi:MliC family protein [Falsirhodobacter sp. alg1]|uniref:MliC family protein n=1 Tax=Falsirhodobacter sp. alg1 TaxID=1472418 RepID=UPI0009E96DD4|nr:MliC family protein [Falsirhodobacter sp. alg1]
MKLAAVAGLIGLAGAAHAETTLQTVRYACERGVSVPATYVNADDMQVAVINVEGRQITLQAEEAASGARYGWPSDGAGYVWWTKGQDATLYWRAGDAEDETPILSECSQAQ